MKKRVNWIKNQEDNLFEMLQNYKLIDIGEKLRPNLDPTIIVTK